MTPARRTADIHADRLDDMHAVDHVTERRLGIVESDHAQGRAALALTLAMHRPLSIATARLALAAAPVGMDVATAQAWAARLI